MNTHNNKEKSESVILTDHDLAKWYEENDSRPYSYRLKIEVAKNIHGLMRFAFKTMGLFKRGNKNALDLQVDHIDLTPPNLPLNFHGTRILFLSDFHLGRMPELPDIIIDKIQGIEADLCLLGGDYRHCCTHLTLPFISELKQIISAVHAPLGIYGVLGNHDGPEIVPAMENLGIQMLINKSVSLQKDDQKIRLIGVDEITNFRRHDLNKAFNGTPKNGFNILLAHSPDIYQETEERGTDLYLCGHTHQGQIRLPWVGPMVTFSRAPRRLSTGLWQHKNMTGYTGPGLGTGAVPVRFRCPPKVVVLTLNHCLPSTENATDPSSSLAVGQE